MSFWSIPSQPVRHWLDDAPLYVRGPANRHARAHAALRLYERRGWNTRAVKHQLQRAQADLEAALERWQDDELQPGLF